MSLPRPKVLIVTRIPFWVLGDGERMRLLALVWMLSPRTGLTILYLGKLQPADIQRLKELRIQAQVVSSGTENDPAAEAAAVAREFARCDHEVCIVERIYLHHVRTAIPPSCRAVLDTHDLLSRHAESRRALNMQAASVTFEDELAVFGTYDRVLLIQSDEHAAVESRLGARALLVPHPVQFPRRPVLASGRRLGLVASRYQANVDGLIWFMSDVWPQLADLEAQLHVFGTIREVWDPPLDERIVRHGFVADFNAVWGCIDVAINPVRWGSGLKIKNVEALGNGLPLVTTSHGAGGLQEGVGSAFVCADTPHAFASACRELLIRPEKREVLGAAAYEFARSHFSPRRCFESLLEWILHKR